jgi:hypothetical protein
VDDGFAHGEGGAIVWRGARRASEKNRGWPPGVIARAGMRTVKIAAKTHRRQACKQSLNLVPFAPLVRPLASLVEWLLKPNHYFEQKATKATKRTTIIKGLLCSLCYLLFKKNEPLE